MPGTLKSPELARKAIERLPGISVLFTSGYTENAIVHGGQLDPGGRAAVEALFAGDARPQGAEGHGEEVRSGDAGISFDGPTPPASKFKTCHWLRPPKRFAWSRRTSGRRPRTPRRPGRGSRPKHCVRRDQVRRLALPSESEKISFNQLNRKTGHRIKYSKVDADTGEEVANEDIVKGYKVDTDTFVEVTKEELENVALESTRTIEIDEFVNRSEIDPRYLIRPYYLRPDGTVGHDAFAVIREKSDVATGSSSRGSPRPGFTMAGRFFSRDKRLPANDLLEDFGERPVLGLCQGSKSFAGNIFNRLDRSIGDPPALVGQVDLPPPGIQRILIALDQATRLETRDHPRDRR
jgi:hypothetical protein